ncbi:MAG TPA: hypothetical protein VFR81_00315 [Longimicrobium sp.]|nr:hypothetical protein [Longimicrobium sp.]
MTSRPPVRIALVIAFALACAAASDSAAAQSLVRGRVVRGGVGVAGVPVQLHRVSRDAQGVVDSAASGADGAFALRRPAGDGAGGFQVVFATATHHGVRYFGPAVQGSAAPDGYEVAVHDTTSAAAAADSVRVTRRDLFLVPDSARGGWRAVEMVRLRNASSRTVVPGARPAVGVTLPVGAEGFVSGGGGESDAPPLGMVIDGERAWASEPILPGERDALYRYHLPGSAGGTELALSEATDTFFLYLPRATSGVRVTGVLDASAVTVEGEPLTRYGGAIRSGARIAIEWGERGGGGSDSDRVMVAVLIAAVLAGVGAWALAARRRRAAE